MASRGAGGRVLACGHERDTSPHLGYTPSLPDVFRAASTFPKTEIKQRVTDNTYAYCVARTRIKPTVATLTQATQVLAHDYIFLSLPVSKH